MGGLTYVTKGDLFIMLIPFAAGMIPLLLLRWRLNILSFDDEEASSLGVDTKKTRAVIILCATLMSSSAVAVGGMIRMGRTDRSAYRQNADRTGLFQDASVLYADGGPFPSDRGRHRQMSLRARKFLSAY